MIKKKKIACHDYYQKQVCQKHDKLNFIGYIKNQWVLNAYTCYLLFKNTCIVSRKDLERTYMRVRFHYDILLINLKTSFRHKIMSIEVANNQPIFYTYSMYFPWKKITIKLFLL